MKGYPVGSLVVLQNCTRIPELNDVECTITAPLESRLTMIGEIEAYLVDFKYHGHQVAPQRCQVRLKKLPPDEAFDKFLNNLKQPVEETV
jgi:hypothetical protein